MILGLLAIATILGWDSILFSTPSILPGFSTPSYDLDQHSIAERSIQSQRTTSHKNTIRERAPYNTEEWRLSFRNIFFRFRVEVWVWSPTKKDDMAARLIIIINPVQSKDRARPMAARLINPVQSKNRARPMAAR